MVPCNIRLIKLLAGKDIPSLPAKCLRDLQASVLFLVGTRWGDVVLWTIAHVKGEELGLLLVSKGLTHAIHLTANKCLCTCDGGPTETRCRINYGDAMPFGSRYSEDLLPPLLFQSLDLRCRPHTRTTPLFHSINWGTAETASMSNIVMSLMGCV